MGLDTFSGCCSDLSFIGLGCPFRIFNYLIFLTESSAMSLFIRHVRALKERCSDSTFVSGFIRIMKHKYVMTEMFLQF